LVFSINNQSYFVSRNSHRRNKLTKIKTKHKAKSNSQKKNITYQTY